MKRRVAVFTGSRAEYGLLSGLMRAVQASDRLALQVIVSGMHLSPEFGETWKELQADGFTIDAKVEMLLSSDTAVGIAKSMGVGTIGFADALDRLRPDVLVVLGDRFEALAVAQVALVLRIPVAQLHGGPGCLADRGLEDHAAGVIVVASHQVEPARRASYKDSCSGRKDFASASQF